MQEISRSEAIAPIQVDSDAAIAKIIKDAVGHRRLLATYVKQEMLAAKDYGKIPGTDKNTLLKPGAEKLCKLFRFVPRMAIVDRVEDWDKGFFHYNYRCSITDRYGNILGEAEGSCNSREKKYRYRNIPSWEATEDDIARAIKTIEKPKKSGYGKNTFYLVENNEPFDLVNTIQKMAQKRALVGAVVIAANASEFFSYEDGDVVDIDAITVDSDRIPDAEPKPVKTLEYMQSKPWFNFKKALTEAQQNGDLDRVNEIGSNAYKKIPNVFPEHSREAIAHEIQAAYEAVNARSPRPITVQSTPVQPAPAKAEAEEMSEEDEMNLALSNAK